MPTSVARVSRFLTSWRIGYSGTRNSSGIPAERDGLDTVNKHVIEYNMISLREERLARGIYSSAPPPPSFVIN